MVSCEIVSCSAPEPDAVGAVMRNGVACFGDGAAYSVSTGRVRYLDPIERVWQCGVSIRLRTDEVAFQNVSRSPRVAQSHPDPVSGNHILRAGSPSSDKIT